jgi:hypothetical protein
MEVTALRSSPLPYMAGAAACNGPIKLMRESEKNKKKKKKSEHVAM